MNKKQRLLPIPKREPQRPFFSFANVSVGQTRDTVKSE
jgi:hypothetical protein